MDGQTDGQQTILFLLSCVNYYVTTLHYPITVFSQDPTTTTASAKKIKGPRRRRMDWLGLKGGREATSFFSSSSTPSPLSSAPPLHPSLLLLSAHLLLHHPSLADPLCPPPSPPVPGWPSPTDGFVSPTNDQGWNEGRLKINKWGTDNKRLCQCCIQTRSRRSRDV